MTTSTAAKQACEVPEQGLEQESLPGSGSAFDILDACPEPESVPGSASGQGKPKQPRGPVAARPMHTRNKKAMAAYQVTSRRKAARKACDHARKADYARKARDHARDHQPKRKEDLKARRAQPNFKSTARKRAAVDGPRHIQIAKATKKYKATRRK